MSIEQIARKLASNVSQTKGENEKPKIELTCFYYTKYDTFDVNYRVNDSQCTLGLVDIKVNDGNVYKECREVRKLAIEELNRVIKTHYKLEVLNAELLEALKYSIKDFDNRFKCDECDAPNGCGCPRNAILRAFEKAGYKYHPENNEDEI